MSCVLGVLPPRPRLYYGVALAYSILCGRGQWVAV